VELRAALVRLARQIVRFRLSVHGVCDKGREAIRHFSIIRFVHESGSSS
jgi:hypothetical protein